MLDPQSLFSIKLSLKVATLSALIVFLTGLPLSYLLALKRFPFKNLLDALITLPLVFPPTVTGYILLLLLGKEGFIGKLIYKLFNTGVVFTWYGAVVAASVAAFPIFVKSARAAIEAVDSNLIKVSYTLGKGELSTFFKVILPLAKRGIVAALVLSFARALGEFGATLMLAGNIPFRTNTIPLEIYSAVSGGDFERANLLTAITASMSVVIIYLINRLTSSKG
ncbi:molybdate ABC transporter permease subunit [Phorcysia thermohydrogeniphila]|uniref:Molybdenum transport system permease n=1 Tax=Phorcysia thermohydrogeniphila TaxID=936138 RepID=A0A4R1GGY6_9BACT|nr:molybdate ABC transporter permease subunit [Phorcysia thermohydrogeniphila]TCK06233.1 molybdate transport system permease protein [Phorcysia thermohydrogeniphila]